MSNRNARNSAPNHPKPHRGTNASNSRPRQWRNASPVDPEVLPPRPSSSSKSTDNGNRTQRQTGLASSYGNPIPRDNPATFARTDLQVIEYFERNDPLIVDAVLIDGFTHAVPCAKERSFQLDFSQYIQIIRSSYNGMTRLDRALQKFVSFSVYQYYCVVLLWKRLRFVLSERGDEVNEYESLKRSLPPMWIPDEIGYYLDGIGYTDYNSRKYNLALQGLLRTTQIDGISGHFGRVDQTSHTTYETIPSPFVAVFRMLQDAARTRAIRRPNPIDVPQDWNLPDDLAADGNYVPNRNLLCWDRSCVLTTEQMSMMEHAGLDVSFGSENSIEYETSGVTNRSGIPIIYHMLLQTSELLSGSKSAFNNHAESTSY